MKTHAVQRNILFDVVGIQAMIIWYSNLISRLSTHEPPCYVALDGYFSQSYSDGKGPNFDAWQRNDVQQSRFLSNKEVKSPFPKISLHLIFFFTPSTWNSRAKSDKETETQQLKARCFIEFFIQKVKRLKPHLYKKPFHLYFCQ